MSVTVIMSGYKRPYSMAQQYDALKRQTYKDINIMVWVNLIDNKIDFPPNVINECQSIMSNTNYGVWGRFALALNAPTEYICIIDDDTIPGSKWIENCFNTMNALNGKAVLTTRGVIATEKDRMYPDPSSYTAHGWCNPNENILRVDMGCHCWFFNKQILRGFWAEMPQTIPMNYGEDMHLSYVAQKYFDTLTYLPPHPVDDKELWGSLPETGKKYGEDEAAISWNSQANMGMNRYWNFIRDNGYKTILETK